MKQFPLESPLDLGTVDIIQSEPQYKQKNSLIYKGILSNMTVQSGRGMLSTTGHQLNTSGSSVYLDNEELIDYSNDYMAVNYTTGKASKVLGYRKIWLSESEGGGEDGRWAEVIVRKEGNNKIWIEFDGDEWDYESEYETAYITRKGIVLFPDSATTVFCLNVINGNYNTLTVADYSSVGVDSETILMAGQPAGSTSYLVIGLDNKDVRRRRSFLYSVSNGVPSSKLRTIHGFGCVHDRYGTITGEPIPVLLDQTVSAATASEHMTATLSTDFYYDRLFLSTSTGGYSQIASNGVHYVAPFNPNATGLYRRSWNDNTSVNSPSIIPPGHEGATYSVSALTETYTNTIAKQGPQTTEGTQASANRPDWYRTSPTFDIGSESQITGGAEYQVQYVYMFQFQYATRITVRMLRATSRWIGQSSTAGIQFNGARISFIDFDNPIGKIGWNTSATNESLDVLDNIYPHLKHFYNDTTRKGLYWDYGPGWCRFFWDTIYVKEYTQAGFSVFENPLRVLTATCTDSFKSTFTYIDFKADNSDCAYMSKPHEDWPYYASTYLGTTEDQREMDPQKPIYIASSTGMPLNTIRMHPRLETYQTGDWFWSHSLTGIGSDCSLSVCPTKFGFADEYDITYYEGIPIAISKGDTLINTPHDISNKWYITFGDHDLVSVSYWDNDTWESIEIARVGSDYTSGRVTMRKIEDYVFVSNILGDKNVFTESRDGYFSLDQGFLAYSMDSHIDSSKVGTYKLPPDASTYLSNDVLYYGSGINSGIKESYSSTSFLLPAVTIQGYVDTSETTKFSNSSVLSRNFPIISDNRNNRSTDIHRIIPYNTNVQEYYTHSQLTTDVSYKNSFYMIATNTDKLSTFEEEYRDTTWIPGQELVIYPIGIASQTYGENYIIATVDAGENYVARFYNKDNKTFLVFNQADLVYYGSEIFTIQSGNYYFDGQGIYYLGSQTDYSQNIFTAYALGMRFLANSSSEAYFYSEWDKSIYLYTASNTLQKSFSLADRPAILDAVYSTQEQCLYILFTDGSVYIKSQLDDCLIEGLDGAEQLQTTAKGAYVLASNKYWICNPKDWTEKLPLTLETEWLGDSVAVQKTSYVDIVLYNDTPTEQSVTIDVQMIQNGIVTSDKKEYKVQKADWKNQFARVRFVPTKENLQGNAVKVIVTSDDISVFSMNIEMNPISDVAATRLRG